MTSQKETKSVDARKEELPSVKREILSHEQLPLPSRGPFLSAADSEYICRWVPEPGSQLRHLVTASSAKHASLKMAPVYFNFLSVKRDYFNWFRKMFTLQNSREH